MEWAKDRHDLISSFKNLTDIQDESGEIARYQTPLPTTMDSIGIMLQSGDYPAVPLPTRKVDRLRIEADHAASKLELEGGRESMLFQEKVKVLTQNISSVTLLEWKPAALSTCGCSHGKKHNLPAEARYEDPLAGKRFGMIDTLTLEVPFATINPGSMREDQWVSEQGYRRDVKGHAIERDLMRLISTSIALCSCDSGVTSVGSRPQKPNSRRFRLRCNGIRHSCEVPP